MEKITEEGLVDIIQKQKGQIDLIKSVLGIQENIIEVLQDAIKEQKEIKMKSFLKGFIIGAILFIVVNLISNLIIK